MLSFLSEVIAKFKNSMEKVHPHRYKEHGPYVPIFDAVINELWQIYQQILAGGDWCLVPPGLFEKRDKPFIAPKESQKRHAPDPDYASAPPSPDPRVDDSSSEKIKKMLPPPPPPPKQQQQLPIGQPIQCPIGGRVPQPRDPWADVVDDSMPHPGTPFLVPETSGLRPPAKATFEGWVVTNVAKSEGRVVTDVAKSGGRVVTDVAKANWGPKPPSYPPPPNQAASSSARPPVAAQTNWGPQQPAFPPPGYAQQAKPPPPASAPAARNRWNRLNREAENPPNPSRTRSRENVAPPVNDAVPDESPETDHTPDEAASDPPTPPKKSEVPKCDSKDITSLEDHKKYDGGEMVDWQGTTA